MIIAAIVGAYIGGFLFSARWLYVWAVKGGHDVADAKDATFLGVYCLAVSLVWPVAVAALLALRFVTRQVRGGDGE